MKTWNVVETFDPLHDDYDTLIIKDFSESLPRIVEYLKNKGYTEVSNLLGTVAHDKYCIDYMLGRRRAIRVRNGKKYYVSAERLKPFIDSSMNAIQIDEMVETALNLGIDLTRGFVKTLGKQIDDRLCLDDMKRDIVSGKRFYKLYKAAYLPGCSYAKLAPLNEKDVRCIDCNGMYLSIIKDKLPCGKKGYIVGNGQYNNCKDNLFIIAVCEIVVDQCKKIDILPMSLMGIRYKEKCRITITNIDLEILKEYYEVSECNIIYGYTWEYKESPFKSECRQYEEWRKSENGATRKIGKAVPNVIAGILAQTPKEVRYNSQKHLVNYNFVQQRKPHGVSIGTYITARGRQIIAEAIRGRENDILRICVDGIHFKGDWLNVEYGTNLGQFKMEREFSAVHYMRFGTWWGMQKNGEPFAQMFGVPAEVKREKLIQLLKEEHAND